MSSYNRNKRNIGQFILSANVVYFISIVVINDDYSGGFIRGITYCSVHQGYGDWFCDMYFNH